MTNREIDALVAEKVMGLEACEWEYIPADPFHSVIVCPKHAPNGLRPPGSGDMPCFDRQKPRTYSTDIAAAWEVLPETPYFVDASSPKDGIDFTFFVGEGDAETEFKATARTLPMARCLAALKAVGEEVAAERTDA